MSLYVCLVLAAELVVLGESEGGKRAVVGALWGAAIGLTLAHIFAFHLANRAVGGGRLTPEEGLAIRLQLAAASGVAAVLSLPFLVLDTSAAITLAGYMAAGFVGTTSYVTARVAGAKQLRALLFGAVMLCIAVGVVLIKVALAPH